MDEAYRSEFEVHFARIDAKLEQRAAEMTQELRAELAALRSDLIKWMFIFWAGNVVTTAGLVLGAVSLLRK